MDVFEGLNKEQAEAVRTVNGPLLILAGAGSGKTRVLTCRTAYLIKECGVNPFNILAITFTNKAAAEMRSRIDNMVGFGSEGIWVSTFHSMCVRILRRYIDRLGFDNSFSIYDADDQKTVMKEVAKRLEINTKELPERAILASVSHYKDELVSVEEAEREALEDFTLRDTVKAYRLYQETLKKNNALDFDDLLVKTVQLFRSCPEVLDSYRDRFRYIMVDEYQDTNTAQFELVSLLAGKHGNICVVGDDDQSIYKFRGANIRNILDFERVYENACVIRLEQNYRSTQNILDAANAVISNNRGRKEKSLWSDRGRGSGIRLRYCDNAYDEADYVVDSIKRKRSLAGSDFRDFAVLFRTNAQSRILEEKFVMSGIPYTVVGGVNFYARREIKDLLAYLKTIDNARDDVAVKRIINVPRRGIGAVTVNKLEKYALDNSLTFFEALKEADKAGVGKAALKLKAFVELIMGLREELVNGSVADLLDRVLDETGYIEGMDAADDIDLKTRSENIEELINKAAAFDEENEGADTAEDLPGASARSVLSRFLEEVALVADIDNTDDNDNRVLLMTLHSAKGLEFPCVFITGMEEGIFPGFGALQSEDEMELEEERRLCYVGITRAKDELSLSCARARMVRGETHYHAASRFIAEIPEKLFQDGTGQASGRARINRQAAGALPSSGPSLPYYNVKPALMGKPYGTADGQDRQRVRSLKLIPRGSDLKKGPEEIDYAEGDRVSHIKFGTGTVQSIVKGVRDYEVTVDFDTAGVRKMLAGFAKLKKM